MLKAWSASADRQRNRELVNRLKSRLPNGWAVTYALIFIAASLGIAFVIARPSKPPRYPIEIHHRVSVLSSVAGTSDEWWISSDEPEPKRLTNMRWKCCPDFDCASVVWPGYIARTVKYEERGACKSIRAAGLGFFWHDAGETWWTKLGNIKEQ